jgi:hypothetical protein
MNKADILQWVKNEFLPVTLVTEDVAILQIVDNAVRYFNSYSAMRTVEMVTASSGSTKIPISVNLKSVVRVIPAAPPTTILMNYPMWSLLGIAILDNVTNDMIAMTEAWKNYKYYIGSDFRWHYERSSDPTVEGNLYVENIPENTTKLCVIGTKRIVADVNADYSITDEYTLNWLLYYIKALVKQVEGNALRKTSAIGVKNDGAELMEEGKTEVEELKQQLKDSGRWIAFVKRF